MGSLATGGKGSFIRTQRGKAKSNFGKSAARSESVHFRGWNACDPGALFLQANKRKKLEFASPTAPVGPVEKKHIGTRQQFW